MLKKLDKCLVICTIILLILGLVMIFSASNVTSYMKYAKSPYYYFLRQSIFLVGSIILSFVILRIDTKKYHYFSFLLMLGVIGLLVGVLVYGKVTNSARSWFNLFGLITLQPSEFAKIITIVWLSCYYGSNIKFENLGKVIFPLLLCLGVAFLIALQPDLGTTILYSGIVFTMFLIIPISKKIKRNTFIGLFIIIGIGLLLLMNNGVKILFDRQLERFNFLNPCDRIYSSGNQVCNGYIAINNGGMFGTGLGNSTQKYLYLPEPYTDFIFTITIEELGCVTGIIILILYLIVLCRILIIGKRSYTNRGSIICYGVSIYIFLHIAVNLLGVFGLMPMTGVPLPFMSYGGSFTICLIAALTAVQRVSIETGIRDNLIKK